MMMMIQRKIVKTKKMISCDADVGELTDYNDELTLQRSTSILDFKTVSSKSVKIMNVVTPGECIEDDDTLFADKSKLGQVIRNLMSNAIKFTPERGTIKLCIKFIPDSQSNDSSAQAANGMLALEVQDSGAGISPENLPRLFKEVVQFNPEKLQGGGGSGFGLMMCKSIVDMHGGQLSVHSEGEGYGSTFCLQVPMTHCVKKSIIFKTPTKEVELIESRTSQNLNEFDDFDNESIKSIPLALRHRLDVNSTLTMNPKRLFSTIKDTVTINSSLSTYTSVCSHSVTSPIIKKRFLLVDDAATNRKILRKLLEHRGHECEEAENGVEGLKMVKDVFRRQVFILATDSAKTLDQYYDAIFMDFVMPEMNGPDATRAIRALGYTGPIIGVTGNAHNDDKAIFTKAGVTDIVIKPLKMNSLIKIINI